MDVALFPPFVRGSVASYVTELEAFSTGYSDLLQLDDVHFREILNTETFELHLDTFLRFAW
jgi:hypothetical protein